MTLTKDFVTSTKLKLVALNTNAPIDRLGSRCLLARRRRWRSRLARSRITLIWRGTLVPVTTLTVATTKRSADHREEALAVEFVHGVLNGGLETFLVVEILADELGVGVTEGGELTAAVGCPARVSVKPEGGKG